MGKKNKTKKSLPKVSVCTPTFNRRPFIPFIIKCLENQTYPKELIEWIIVDDGTDPIGDIVKDIPNVKYFYFEEKMSLGKKRNLCHSKATGDILVNMDDDDYYPPTRISHGVNILQKHPSFLIAGSSQLYMHFKHLPEGKQMIKFGPYKDNHGTAATFVFRRELLEQTSYDEDAALAEEKHFLKDYTIPLYQLDPKQVILCFSHNHNSFDKKALLGNIGTGPVNYADDVTVDDIIKEEDIKKFFIEDIDYLLEGYIPGRPENKPDVIEQTIELTKKRNEQIENMRPVLIFKDGEGKESQMNRYQILEKVNTHQTNNEFNYALGVVNNLLDVIRVLQDMNKQLQDQVNSTIATS